MSEENHEIQNEEEIAENIKSLVKAGKKKITVEHVFKDERRQQLPTDDGAQGNSNLEDDDEDVREQLRKREAQLAALALKEFEQKKEEVLSLVEPEKRESAEKFVGDDPEKLKFLMYQTGYSSEGDDDGTEIPPPKGKVKALGAQGTAPNVNRKYTNPTVNMVSDLFGILRDPKKSEEEKAVANQKIDDLYIQIAKGRKNNPNFKMISGGAIMTCPSCGHVVQGIDLDEGSECPYCGWKRDGMKTRKIRHDYTMKPK